jgi:hypothetical protein
MKPRERAVACIKEQHHIERFSDDVVASTYFRQVEVVERAITEAVAEECNRLRVCLRGYVDNCERCGGAGRMHYPSPMGCKDCAAYEPYMSHECSNPEPCPSKDCESCAPARRALGEKEPTP